MPELEADQKPIDLTGLRAKVAESPEREMWRGVEELAGTATFHEIATREFPRHTPPWASPMDRRAFLKVSAASVALAGLVGCREQPIDKIVPYVKSPEDLLPGMPAVYATTMTIGGYGVGALVHTTTGRPIKVDGNPDHPATFGSSDALLQSTILAMYDPDRSQAVLKAGTPSSWDVFDAAASEALNRGLGSKFRVLTETVTSPSVRRAIAGMLAAFPGAKHHVFEPLSRDNAREGARLAFGAVVDPVYDFTRADVVLSLDADFMTFGPGAVRYMRDFTSRRRTDEPGLAMNRLYAVTCVPSVTSSNADNNLPARFEEVETFARSLSSALGIQTGGAASAEMSKWVGEVAKDLAAHRGKCAILAGEHQPPAVHALAHAMNAALGNVGQTVQYIAPLDGYAQSSRESIEELSRDMAAGAVEALVILGGNPVYAATPELRFGELLPKVGFSLHLSAYEDETSNLCMWHAPLAHDLEAWGDGVAFDGTKSICQPMIEPLLGGRSMLDVILHLSGDATLPVDFVRQTHSASGDEAKDAMWQTWLHDGVIPNSAADAVAVAPIALRLPTQTPHGAGKRIVFLPDPGILDGRNANLAWLQELPRPLSKLTWDNAFLVSAKMADELGFFAYDPATGKRNMSAIGGRSGGSAFVPVLEVSLGGKKLKGPAWLMAGLPEDTIAVMIGYGRTRGGRVAKGAGFDVNPFRTQAALWTATGASTAVTDETFELACTQLHWSMEGRNFVREATVEEFSHEPDYVKHLETIHEEPQSIYPDREYNGNKWGMVIDTTMCTGCNACTVACQAENNIPAVGKRQVIAAREMHWIRIDRYYSDDLDHPATHHLPVTCMHCELAPCETVCPVAATTHDEEGLNQMVYNRCIGTRYCSNNCPYKVRRFNFMLYTDNDTPITRLLQNPDVTVRGRGVMEKCTYCVQRINAARKTAKKENRPIKDGEIVTACQQACPAKAITFGNLNDPDSEVARLAKQPHNYYLLKDLNTRPRTTYLGKVRNPNPALAGPKKEAAGAH